MEPGTLPCDEPKFIVFYGMLLSLFSMFCFNCKSPNPQVDIKKNGSMAVVTQRCSACGPTRSFQWNSQPYILGRHAAGNLMTSFAILMSGVSISKVFLLFKHLGLCSITSRAYYIHQNKFLFPSVIMHWEKQQKALIEKLKKIKDAAWSGDGRFDSMGHSAKYGAYSMFCNSISKIVHFEIRQVGIILWPMLTSSQINSTTGTYKIMNSIYLVWKLKNNVHYSSLLHTPHYFLHSQISLVAAMPWNWMELNDASSFSRIVDYKFQYLLVIVTRGLQSGFELLRRKPNTSMICGMFPKDFPKRS